MLESLWHQLGARLHAEVLHDRVFVKGHGARSYLRRSAISFIARPSCEELQHFRAGGR